MPVILACTGGGLLSAESTGSCVPLMAAIVNNSAQVLFFRGRVFIWGITKERVLFL